MKGGRHMNKGITVKDLFDLDKTVAEKLLILYQKDICKCEACGGKLSSFRLRGSYSLTG